MNKAELVNARDYWSEYKRAHLDYGAADRFMELIDKYLADINILIKLRASDLVVADGFDNGHLLEKHLAGYVLAGPSDWLLSFEQEVLVRCVERYLMPALHQSIKIHRLRRDSNPIFVDAKDTHKIDGDIVVEITRLQVRTVAELTKEEMRRGGELGNRR
ncbi:hypothetical protein HB780_02255 (plasmid) [Rhizobium lusitanum]|uniref:hypothetical protein n=1 Tax=Rhizobium lusitanum TaxID=293958 RepID=UPI00161E71CE|nr:hypothetical protein [Rhizobium lusitanum]QND44631.1 hypothetical protein HB780_02255 [Rhizobium lusitanum]